MFFILNFSQAWATSTPQPTQNQSQDQDQNQQQGQAQGQLQDQSQTATGIGVGVGIAGSESNSNAVSGSNSNAIVGVKSENNNINTNNIANVNTANGGQGGAGTAASYATITNEVAAPIATSGDSISEANAQSGDSTSEAVNNVQVGDSISTIGDTISTSEIGDINAGNSFKSSYFNSEKLDSYDTFIQVGNTRKSVPNISGYAGMNRYDYRDSWEFGIRMTIPLFTGVTDKAIEYETAKIETENDYLNAQITALNADNERKQAIHIMEIQNIQQAYVADRQQIKEKHQAEMAVLCKGIKETLKQIEGSNDLWQICNGFELVTPPVRVVEKIKWRTAKPKLTPCELCEKEKQTIVTTPAN